MQHIFKFIKADQFFPAYAPTVTSYKKKLSGKNGRGNPVDFSDQDKKLIREGLKKLFKEISK